jgi:hypothetical protein
VRDRVHVPLVLQRQQQQRKHGETDGTTHGVTRVRFAGD